MTVKTRKKLIEVALPLEAINKASVRESYIYRGNPSSLHKWWAQRPLASARAVIFAQMVDDPTSWPELFPTEKAQEKERKRLFKIIEDLVQWENTTNEEVLQRARDAIWDSWRRACAENADHPRARELFNRDRLPAFHDPFAGGGSLPLEAQRLGLEAYASDLNPVAVLICKAMIEIPPKFAGRPPVNPEARKEQRLLKRERKGAEGLAEDVRYYGKWMRDEAEKRIGHLYPKVLITADMVKERPDLKPYKAQKLTVIAWLWARTVKSPNPAFAHVDVPLASTFMLSTKAGKEVYVEPVIENGSYRFAVKVGRPSEPAVRSGTKLGRGASFKCIMSGTPIEGDFIKAEAQAGRMNARLMAVVADGGSSRLYISPPAEHEQVARKPSPSWSPDVAISGTTQYLGVKLYGMERFSDLFTPRQLSAMVELSGLVRETREMARRDAVDSGLQDDGLGGTGSDRSATAYADAIAIYAAFAVDKYSMYGNALVPWYSKEDRPSMLFSQQVFPMVWDYTELNPLTDVGGGISRSVEIVAQSLEYLPVNPKHATITQRDARSAGSSLVAVTSTDPPYYDNVPYSDLSDFFYVWLRRALKECAPELFATVSTPKADELVAFSYRHNGNEEAEKFFLDGMTRALCDIGANAHPGFPVTIYYAFKQAETQAGRRSSTGWDTFLEAVIRAGFSIHGTWPMRTERSGRLREAGYNAMASSIVLVCRRCDSSARSTSRQEFVAALKAELPPAVEHLKLGNIPPVDLAQAAIGPGMAIYSRFHKVVGAEGGRVPVRDALALINQTLDEILAEQEGDFDADTRWALAWFEQHGFVEGEFGTAETLSKAKNTSVQGMESARILEAKRGKVRLLRPDELSEDWDPSTDTRLTAWEIVHQLIRALEGEGEQAAAGLVAKLGSRAEAARDLAYRLYAICERKKRAPEALAYNGLVQAWPEVLRLASEKRAAAPRQATYLGEE